MLYNELFGMLNKQVYWYDVHINKIYTKDIHYWIREEMMFWKWFKSIKYGFKNFQLTISSTLFLTKNKERLQHKRFI